MIEWLLKFCLTIVSSSLVGLLFYRAALSPLSRLPGPWYSLFSDVCLMYKEFTGSRRVYIHELHKTFGPVVRIGPKEVSFTSPDALRKIYQLGGSGYDKTNFYELFMQYDTRCVAITLHFYAIANPVRTMFSTLDRRGVSVTQIEKCELVLTMIIQHDLLKRQIAGAYTNSSIMQSEVLEAIRERTEDLLRQCSEAGEKAIDFYVSLTSMHLSRTRSVC